MSEAYSNPETTALIKSLYLNEGLPPRAIEERLREIGVELSSGSIRQYLSRHGITKQRREVDARIETKLAPAVIADARIERTQAAMDRWASGAEQAVDRALAEANKPGARIRDVSVAVSTAMQGAKLFRMSIGLEDRGGGGPRQQTNNFIVNFARGPGSPFRPDAVAARARAAAEAKPAVVVDVEARPAA